MPDMPLSSSHSPPSPSPSPSPSPLPPSSSSSVPVPPVVGPGSLNHTVPIAQPVAGAPHIFDLSADDLKKHRQLWCATCFVIICVPQASIWAEYPYHRTLISRAPDQFDYAGVRRWVGFHDLPSAATSLATGTCPLLFIVSSFTDVPNSYLFSALITASHFGSHAPLIASRFFTTPGRLVASPALTVYLHNQSAPITVNCSALNSAFGFPSGSLHIHYQDERISPEATYALTAALAVSVVVYFYLVHAFRGRAINKELGPGMLVALVVSMLWESVYTMFISYPLMERERAWAVGIVLILKWMFVSTWMSLVYLKHRSSDTSDVSFDLLQILSFVGKPVDGLYTAFQKLPAKVVQKALKNDIGVDVPVEEEKEGEAQNNKPAAVTPTNTVVQRKKPHKSPPTP